MSWNMGSTNFSGFTNNNANPQACNNTSYNAKVHLGNTISPPYELYQGSSGQQQCFQNSLNGTLEKTPLSTIFFSSNNIDYIQNRIIVEVHNRSNGQYQIGRQSDLQLQIIMRSIYLSDSRNLLCNFENQVTSLNEKVIKEAVDKIIPQIQQYLGYRKEISTPRCIMTHPVNVSNKGSKTYDLTAHNRL